jgi:hypothetical protein
VRRAGGRLDLGQEDQGLGGRLQRARPSERRAQVAQRGVAGEAMADRGRIALPQRGELVEQRGGDERLVVLDRLADPAGERGGDRGAGAGALGAGREQPQPVDRLLAVTVVAQLDLRVRPHRVEHRGTGAAAPERGERGPGAECGAHGGDRCGDRGDPAAHDEQASIVVALR